MTIKHTKHPGSLPIVQARIVEVDGRKKAVDYCPRGLSRKKLRRLMPGRRNDFSGTALATRYNRTPGWGRTRRGLLSQLDRMEQDALKHGEERFEAVARTMLTKLRMIFSSRRKAVVRSAPRKG